VYTFGDIRSRNPTVYAVNNNTFCVDTTKIGIGLSRLRISWTYLDLLYRFGRRIGGDDYPNIPLAVDQGTLLWQLVKFGGWSQTLPGTTCSPRFGVQQWIGRRNSAFKRLNGNISATSGTNLVNLCPILSEFTLLKCAIFAAILPQFDDDLHSSSWHLKRIGRSQF